MMPGATSMSYSISLELIEDSRFVNPVILPPGSAKLAMLPTGSETWMNTMGMARVRRWSAACEAGCLGSGKLVCAGGCRAGGPR